MHCHKILAPPKKDPRGCEPPGGNYLFRMLEIPSRYVPMYYITSPWSSTTIKITVDPIPMIKTLRQAMVVILTPIVLMAVGIPG